MRVRKELYEFEHPETKVGGDRKSKDGIRLLKVMMQLLDCGK